MHHHQSVDDIIAHADELAKRFEDYDPHPDDFCDAKVVHDLRAAAQSRSSAESDIRDAVVAARKGGYSWTLIGSELGTSGEAARQRYGSFVS